LYPALYRAGFANQALAESRSDGLILKNIYITAAGRCVPPDNKPSLEELNNCQPYLEREIQIIKPKVIVCLGRIAFERILKIYSSLTPTLSQNGREGKWKFSHGALYKLNTDPLLTAKSSKRGHWLLCSYHPSQQNTLTGKLTVKMFDEIWEKAKELIDGK